MVGEGLFAAVGCTEKPSSDTSPTMVSDAPPPVTFKAPDSPEAVRLRARLVDGIERRGGPWDGATWDERVLREMREVPRHVFVPNANLVDAYRDAPHPIGLGQTISQPTVVAMMTQALELRGDEKVLEIGTGSGYQAAILGKLAKKVFTIEIHEQLANEAKDKLAGFPNVVVRAGDGYAGWPQEAPFDRILLTAAPPELPQALVDQLAEGGILVAPVGPDGWPQRLFRYRKRGGKLVEEDLGGVMFVPMVKGDGGP